MTLLKLVCLGSVALNVILVWAYWMSCHQFKKAVNLCDDVLEDNRKIREECRKLVEEVHKGMSELEDDGDAWKRQ